ncbi:MAG TPA: hypothetical protein VNK91_01765 [Burkholderiaceae bacterium]|jgi:hypothetical protein|nr:hypothetical protein [Burkholderiaceae bacterium]
MTKLIRTHAQLLELRSPRVRRGVWRVELAVPGYPREVRRLQHQINRNLRARGWAVACGFALAGLLGLAALLWLQPAALATPLARAAAALAVLLLAAMGRQIGLLRADRRMCAAIESYRTASV